MRFFILLFVLLSFGTAAIAQTKKTISPTAYNKKQVGDSSTLKIQDSIPYASFCFYRIFNPRFNAAIKKIDVYINNLLVYKVKATSKVILKIYKEGNYTVAIDDKAKSEIPIKVKFGKEYFFKCAIVKGVWFGKPAIESVTLAVGKSQTAILEIE